MRWPVATHDSLVARLMRLSHPGYSWCLRCGRPWPNVTSHSTDYGGGRGCFPLCQSCWDILGSPEARIEYYAMLIAKWESDHPVEEDTKMAIQKAVANGG
jgi:hypothetical protein